MGDETSKGEIRGALALADAIRQQMDGVVQQAERAVRLLKPTKDGESELRENQIRNVLAVAEESQSVPVVANFIRYQIGRAGSRRGWQYGGFGVRVIQDIETGALPAAATAAAAAAAQAIGAGADQEALRKQAHLELTRYYLGYLNRAFTFCTKLHEAKNQDIDPWALLAPEKEG